MTGGLGLAEWQLKTSYVMIWNSKKMGDKLVKKLKKKDGPTANKILKLQEHRWYNNEKEKNF